MKKHFIYTIILYTLIVFNSCGSTQTEVIKVDSRSNINRDEVVNYAKKQIGVNYKYAGNSPQEGFDCSGFTNYVFSNFGHDVPRRSIDYEKTGKSIPLKDCNKGDIILFTGSDKTKRITGHVGIVVSNINGNVSFIHASTSRGVVISDLKVKYYEERFLDVRRIIN